jgi:endogenous inhibitor of DNA gyrase (YacG/DUF329 family)
MNKKCNHCNIEFLDKSRSKTATFCSKECKNKNWYLLNKEHAIASSNNYVSQNKEQVKATKRKYVKNRKLTDINFRLASNLRSRISRAMVNNFKHSSLSEYLGCTIQELKNQLEFKFQPGMTWDNYGEWEIDHIYPLAKSDLTDPNMFAKVCHYTNLQPLWSLENKIKKDSV